MKEYLHETYLYEIKALLFHIRLTCFVFFPDSLESWVNLENIHPTLTVVKIAIAVKSIELKNNISPTSAGM